MARPGNGPCGLLRSHAPPSSFIRTVTVGSGIGPDLLTLRFPRNAVAGGARGLVRASP
ncbi:hypothetical protein J2X06_002363 [Lysobacter niastensis]|uniref:Uncharacterized protein n=1 Tax=Lysobacter niastensis TaxID=380629 RepID=A0ABU1WC74_9GAMM|nr:hypothetical protein [Lysobacter niastensis]